MTTEPATQTQSLAAFLLERLDEDEAAARAASPGPWECVEVHQAWQVQTVATFGTSPQYAHHQAITMDREGMSDSVSPEDGTHIARHDPARVLADVAARRAIVALHPVSIEHGHCCSDPDDPHLGEVMFWGEPCPTLRHLASVYSDQPGWREEWGV